MASIQDVINYVASWRENNGILEEIDLTIEQLTKLAKDVQSKIGELSFKAPVEGANIIPYNGFMGDTAAWKFAKAASENSGGAFCYNASVENFSIVEKFSYLCAFQRGGRYTNRLLDNESGTHHL